MALKSSWRHPFWLLPDDNKHVTKQLERLSIKTQMCWRHLIFGCWAYQSGRTTICCFFIVLIVVHFNYLRLLFLLFKSLTSPSESAISPLPFQDFSTSKSKSVLIRGSHMQKEIGFVVKLDVANTGDTNQESNVY